MAFTIAQITDTHISDAKPFFAGNFAHAVAALNEARPDLVVNTGDVSINGAEDAEDLAAARRLHEGFAVPWRVLAGNHDIGDCVEVAKHAPIDAESVARWRGVFGENWWLEDVPGWRILGIDALLLGSGLELDFVQQEFIRDAVAGLGGRALMLMTHKPLFDRQPGETAIDGMCITPGPRAVLLDALGAARPRLVAVGHVHQWRQIEVAGSVHVSAPSLAFVTPPWFRPGYGTRMIGYVEHVLHADGSFATQPAGISRTVMHDLADFPEAYGEISRLKEMAQAEAAPAGTMQAGAMQVGAMQVGAAQ